MEVPKTYLKTMLNEHQMIQSYGKDISDIQHYNIENPHHQLANRIL